MSTTQVEIKVPKKEVLSTADKDAKRSAEIKEKAKKFDKNGDGQFSYDEVSAMYIELMNEGGHIKYNLNDPVDKKMADYDKDGNGNFDYHEVYNIIDDLNESHAQQSVLKKFIGLLALIVFALIGALLGVTLAANEMSKENHVDGGEMTALDGSSVKVDTVLSYSTLWDMPKLEMAQLSKMESFSGVIKRTSLAAGASWPANADITVRLAGATLATTNDDEVLLSTSSGATIYVNSATKKATLTMADGSRFDVVVPASRRSLHEEKKERLLMSPKEYLEFLNAEDGVPADRPRRRLRRGGGAPSSSASFSMSSGNRAGNS